VVSTQSTTRYREGIFFFFFFFREKIEIKDCRQLGAKYLKSGPSQYITPHSDPMIQVVGLISLFLLPYRLLLPTLLVLRSEVGKALGDANPTHAQTIGRKWVLK
jgi:hypothetical protein